MSMTIYTMTHKPFTPPPDRLYQPLQVGSALHESLGYLSDNEGDNISERNPYYSELTGHYWVWKNDKHSDYVGCVHYRRYLVNEKQELYTEAELSELLKEYDLVTTKLLTLEYSYYDAFDDRHNAKDLDVLGEVIKELAPRYYENYVRLVHEKRTYFGNMFVMSKSLYDDYMEFLFPLLFEAQKRIDMTGYDGYQKRLFGFFSEFLLYVWTTTNGLKVKEAMVGLISEKAETKELKEQIADFFRKKDVAEAKECFLRFYRKRPDILMEVSDINRECRLAMQAISSLEWEEKRFGHSRLEKTTDFYELIDFYRRLNRLVLRYGEKAVTVENLQKMALTPEEQKFLREQQISPVEYEIARRVNGFCDEVG